MIVTTTRLISFVVMVVACFVLVPVFAQDSLDYSEQYFYELLDDGYTLDEARTGVAESNNSSDAAWIAVGLCAPDREPIAECEYSQVWNAWVAFLDGYDVRDPDLADAIEDYWCSYLVSNGCQGNPAEIEAADQSTKSQIKASNSGMQNFGGKKGRSKDRTKHGKSG